MIFFKKFLFNRVFICYLTIAFLTVSFASSASAMFIPSPCEGDSTSHRETDLQKIQKLLESKLIEHKLSKLGLTKDEIQERLHQLDNEQLHLIAIQIHTLEPGGDIDPSTVDGLVYLVIIGIALVVALLVPIISWFHHALTTEPDDSPASPLGHPTY